MRTALSALGQETFDVCVVGAGLHGVAAAWTAARLGLRVALIDAGDFGGATSSASLKVLHGGLRYLQHGNFRRMRESIIAHRRFFQLAPHLCRPQAFLMPTRGGGVRSRAALGVALALNDLISADRNAGVHPSRHLPPGRLLTCAETETVLAGARVEGLTGGAVWYDGIGESTERLTLGFVLGAERAGAVVVNYCKASALRLAGGAVEGVEAQDVLDGGAVSIRARAVVNAAGPWFEQPWAGVPRVRHPLVGAWNVVVPRQWFGAYGVALEGVREHVDAEALVQRGRRNFFCVPWRGATMIGTVYEPYDGDPAAYRPSRSAVQAFLDELHAVFPAAQLAPEDLSFLHIGVQPGPCERGAGSVEPDKHSEVVEAAAQGGPRGLWSIKGVKYTTGLLVGERAALAAARGLGRAGVPVDAALPGGERLVPATEVMARARALGLAVTQPAAARLAGLYGVGADAVLEEARADDAALLPGAPESLLAEVRHAVRREHALTLADVVLRRTDLGTLAAPPAATLRAAASVMAALLGWDAPRVDREIDAVRRVYPAHLLR